MAILKRIVGYLRPYWRRVIVAYVALLIGTAMQLAVPRLVEYVIDSGLVASNLRVVTLGTLAIVTAGLLQGAFTFVRSYLFTFLAERVSFDIRNDLYRHLQALPFSFFDRAHTGQLMSRATEDVNSIRRFLMFSMRSLVQSVGMLIVVSIILITTHWRLALLSLSVMPILAWTAIHFGRTIRPRFLAVQQQFGVMTNVLQENLAGARVVRAFAREEDERAKFDRAIQRLYERSMDTVRRSAFYFPLMTLLSSLGLAFILWYGGRQVALGNLSIGKLTAFYFYLAMLSQPIRLLGWVVNSLARALASGERIFEVLDTRPAIASPPNAVRLSPIEGHVAFEHVWVRYPGASEDALADVTFTAEPGQRIALLGKPGSGKSTLTSLIPRFYDVTAGSVRIDGVDVRELDLEVLRRQVGIVLQDTFLFGVSIRDNIAYGRPDATDEEIEAAARAAQAHDFITALPEGYDTIVGERGVSLSGGQKQRVALARALVMDPRILILDDATSNVDTETEHAIQRALDELMVGRTTFIIAHRLVTLKRADLILVLDRGRIVERGTHETLLRNGGLYAEIYDLQLRDQEDLAEVAD
ncbi:ABC transporter ATP-binding protein [Sphaerobacter sp.]|uniref:ABC transporter ATP-binding protein n=1 Tax=Sphaerobacter sp. TaxID=2099654 RepID=UPI001DA1A147|nr:ABC transporter ATP-binding protein [Sphaerobacter sp.]MBX5444704.1 ABC transporter ATP-binding protein [Sphaerobacter sp.]